MFRTISARVAHVVSVGYLICTPAHAQSKMSQLQYELNYDQGDVYYTYARSPGQCSDICLMDDRCVAMTYIISSRQCWIKNVRNSPSKIGGMVSAIKQGVVPPPPVSRQ